MIVVEGKLYKCCGVAGGGGEGKTEGGEKKQFFALLGDRSSYSYLFIVVESFIFHRTKDT